MIAGLLVGPVAVMAVNFPVSGRVTNYPPAGSHCQQVSLPALDVVYTLYYSGDNHDVSKSVFADAQGYYSFTVPVDPSSQTLVGIDITPLPGNCYHFDAGGYPNIIISHDDAYYTDQEYPYAEHLLPGGVTNANFALVLDGPTYSLSIRVVDESGNGVQGVTLNGLWSPSPVTNAQGYYQKSCTCGAYVVRPSLPGQPGVCGSATFQPETLPVDQNNTSLTFTKYDVNSVTISGKITNQDGTDPGVIQINGFPTPANTASNGSYTKSVPCGWTGTITPYSASPSWSFEPGSIQFNTPVNVQILHQDFTRKYNPTITVHVTSGAGAVSAIGILRESDNESCPSATYITDANGTCSFIVPNGWSGRVTCRPSGQWKAPSPLAELSSGLIQDKTINFTVHQTSTWLDGASEGLPIDIESCDLSLNTSPSFPADSKTLAAMTDGNGGTFVAWYTERGGYKRIYLQKLDAQGNLLWDGRGLYLGVSGVSIDIAGATDCGQPLLVKDGTDGVYVVWTSPEPDRFIRVQHVTGAGGISWGPGVSLEPYQINDSVFYPWQGEPLWINQSIDAIPDGAGGIILAWIRSANYNTIRLTHILPSKECGSDEWGYCAPDYKEIRHYPPISGVNTAYAGAAIKLLQSQTGDGILTWQEGPYGYGTDGAIYAVGVSTNGGSFPITRLFSSDPCLAMEYHEVCSDGANGAIVVAAQGSLGKEVRAQKIDQSGNILWGANGKLVLGSETDNYGSQPDVAVDGNGGAFVVWNQGANGDVYAQHLLTDGTSAWGSTGMVVCDFPANQRDLKVEKASDNTPIVAWSDDRSGVWNLYAEKLSSNGAPQWNSDGDGVPIVQSAGNQTVNQTRHQIVPDLSQGAIFIWRAGKDDKQQPFAMRRAGGFGNLGITNEQAYTDSLTGVGQYFAFQYGCAVSWKTNVAATTKVKFRPKNSGEDWQTQTTPTPSTGTSHYLRLKDLHPNTLYEIQPVSEANGWTAYGMIKEAQTRNAGVKLENFHLDQTVIVDEDDNPSVELTVTYSTTGGPSSCQINLRQHLSSPVAFGNTAEFIWSPAHATHTHIFSQVYSTAGVAGPILCSRTYDMVISLWEGPNFTGQSSQYPDGFNGNYSNNLTRCYVQFTTPGRNGGGSHYEFTMLGDGVYENALFSNSPNPFASTTGIRFTVKEDSRVRLDIFDLQGRIVRTLANESMRRGLHELSWDRRSANGERVNSGIYFYRLAIGQFIDTKKMVVLR